MEAMVKKWTDERLEERFDRIDAQLERLDADIRDVRADVRDVRAEMNSRFDAIDARFDATQRMMVQVGGGMIATFLVGFLGLIATQL